MKITRLLQASTFRYAFAAFLAIATVPGFARQGAEEATSTLISFGESNSLRSTDAVQILAERLHVRAGVDELRAAYDEHPGNGVEVQRFNQYFKGIRIAHGAYTLTSKDGKPSFAFGKYYDVSAAAGIAPQLTEADALEKALQSTGAAKYMWDVNPALAAAPKGELQFVEDFSYGQPDGSVRLAYAFDIYAAEPLSRNMVYVDAASGKILFTDAILKHVAASGSSLYSGTVNFEAQLSGSVYTLSDVTRGNGIFTYNLNNSAPSGGGGNGTFTSITSATTTFAGGTAIDAHWGAEQVYDYWKTQRGRNSWDGLNGALKSYVHYGVNYLNAFWDGAAMNYGDGGSGYGAFTALDVCGHEIGHGVCQKTAALVYSGESGGMNEGFSDIWGAVIESFGDPHETDATAKNTWLIGEELNSTAPLRDMSNPMAYKQPDTYLGRYWIYTGAGCDQNNDHCGVHTSSGVLNKWFYLMCVGGKGANDLGTPYAVQAMGMSKAATIAYNTELVLNSTANYASCRSASIAAATTLYGACSKEVETVTRAWAAVGVGVAFSACAPQVSFAAPAVTADENAHANACAPSTTYNLPIVLNGPAPTGGNAVVTVTAIGGTAVAGVDYALPATPSVTFAAGSSLPQNLAITIFDNAYIGAARYVDLVMSVNAGSSNVSAATVLDTVRLTIASDDRAPLAGGTEYRTIGITGATPANASSPFLSAYLNGRGQYIYTAQELATAGLRPGIPIATASFNVTQKFSTQPFANYTMKLGYTAQSNFTSGFINNSGFTTVYSSSLATSTGWNAIPFNTPFAWDGTSNIVVEVCFSNTSAAGSANDRVTATSAGSGAATANSSSVSGCALSLSSSGISYYRPVMRFSQNVAPTAVDLKPADARSWNMNVNQSGYFYSATDGSVIAGIQASSADLGCVTAAVTAQGTGFKPASGGSMRSIREVSINPGAPVAAGTTYAAIIYFRNDDLDGQDPANMMIVQTSSVNDDTLLPSNTSIMTPTDVISGADWTAFRGIFSGFGRFYLSNGRLALGVSGPAAKADELWTGVNPFTTSPTLRWNLAGSERVSIRLTDVTGKAVFSAERTLEAGLHSAELTLNTNLAPGIYVLQVVRPAGVFTRQMIKQ